MPNDKPKVCLVMGPGTLHSRGRHRLDTYREKTMPLIDYYEQRGVLKRVDGSLKPEEVGNRIRALLATLRMEEEL